MFRGDHDVPAGSCSSPQTIRPDRDPIRDKVFPQLLRRGRRRKRFGLRTSGSESDMLEVLRPCLRRRGASRSTLTPLQKLWGGREAEALIERNGLAAGVHGHPLCSELSGATGCGRDERRSDALPALLQPDEDALDVR